MAGEEIIAARGHDYPSPGLAGRIESFLKRDGIVGLAVTLGPEITHGEEVWGRRGQCRQTTRQGKQSTPALRLPRMAGNPRGDNPEGLGSR